MTLSIFWDLLSFMQGAAASGYLNCLGERRTLGYVLSVFVFATKHVVFIYIYIYTYVEIYIYIYECILGGLGYLT